MTTPSTWVPDPYTYAQLDMNTEGLPGAALKDSSPVARVDLTSVNGTGHAFVTGFFAGTNARSLPLLNAYYVGGYSGRGGTQLTFECLLKCSSLQAAEGLFLFCQNLAGTYEEFSMRLETDGRIRAYLNPNNEHDSYILTSTDPIFPAAGYKHVRATADLVAKEFKIYAADPGSTLVLVGSMALGTHAAFSAGTMQVAMGSFGATVEAIQFIRLSTAVRATSDTFPAGAAAANPPTVTSAALDGNQNLVVTFSRAVQNDITLVDPTRYTITPPAGSSAVSVVSATRTSPTQVTLGLSGQILNGGTYTLTVASGTAHAVDTGDASSSGAPTFAGSGTPALAASATVEKSGANTLVHLSFTRAVRQVSAANADDALHAANYGVSPSDSIISVTSVSASKVNLLIGPTAPGISYNLTISNVKDLAGNVI